MKCHHHMMTSEPSLISCGDNGSYTKSQWESNHVSILVYRMIFVDIFRGLLGTSDDKIDKFVKSTHPTNSARTANWRILIPTGTIIKLKSLLFELEDRECCGVLPNVDMFTAIRGPQLDIMRTQCSSTFEDAKKKKEAVLSIIDVPSFIGQYFKHFCSNSRS